MSHIEIDETPCPLADGTDGDANADVWAGGRPPRRKRVAFALWFGALIAAAAVITIGAAPLLAP